MRILWLCNIVLPEFCNEFNIKHTNLGGWMSGMLCAIKMFSDIEIGLCFPIQDENRMKNSIYEGNKYYSFHSDMKSYRYSDKMVREFQKILLNFRPDVVHIWGTEYNHAGAIIEACVQLGLQDRVLIHVQGLVSVYAKHYAMGLTEKWLSLKTDGYNSIYENITDFELRGQNEIEAIQRVCYVSGRTEWDYACVKQNNKQVNYRKCEEILRGKFYTCKQKWNVESCKRHSIFVSQAAYPIKGFHFLLAALPIVRNIYPDIKVYVSGRQVNQKDENGNISPYGVYINYLIKKHHLEGIIEFLGSLDEVSMIKQYLQANVFVSASTIENSPNSICEAMYLGLPVIASYVGGVMSLIEHNRTGLLYPCDADYMLADCICRVFGNDRLAKKFSEFGWQTAKIRQDSKKIAQQNYDIYKEIIEKY